MANRKDERHPGEAPTVRIPSTLVDSIDRIHALVRESRRVPWTNRLLVDEDELLELAQALERAIPEELRQARRILADREQILETARQEAGRLVEAARRQAAELSSDSGIAREAQTRAQQVVDRAHRVSQELRLGAVRYADDTLDRLERDLASLLETVRQHRQELRALAPGAGKAAETASG